MPRYLVARSAFQTPWRASDECLPKLLGVAIILPQIALEMNPPHVAFGTLALYMGLITGAVTWVRSPNDDNKNSL
jgi:hypothetical protein